MKAIRDPSNIDYSYMTFEGLEDYLSPVEDLELSEKPWKDGRKKSKPKKPSRRRQQSDDWEETQRARARYLKEWEEDIRYAKELADESF